MIIVIFVCPVIEVQPHPQPYLAALLPKDQDIDTLDPSDPAPYPAPTPRGRGDGDGGQRGEGGDGDASIDNPYLMPVKMPKYKKFKTSWNGLCV